MIFIAYTCSVKFKCMESKIDILKIKELLPHGAQTEIALRCKLTVCHVNRVLNGKSDNTQVLEAIADYLTEFKKKKVKALSRLSSLID